MQPHAGVIVVLLLSSNSDNYLRKSFGLLRFSLADCGCEEWAEWSLCSKEKCGGGTKTRKRSCASKFCTSSTSTQRTECNMDPCPSKIVLQ